MLAILTSPTMLGHSLRRKLKNDLASQPVEGIAQSRNADFPIVTIHHGKRQRNHDVETPESDDWWIRTKHGSEARRRDFSKYRAHVRGLRSDCLTYGASLRLVNETCRCCQVGAVKGCLLDRSPSCCDVQKTRYSPEAELLSWYYLDADAPRAMLLLLQARNLVSCTFISFTTSCE